MSTVLATLAVSISLLLFLSLSSPALSAHPKCNPQDKKVLLQIKADLNNPYHLASWNPHEDCCTWYAMECHRVTGRVIALTIFQGEISGQIPPAVGDLPYLQSLVFRHLTNLTGRIPSSIAKLTHLTDLTLSWTDLSGPVPSFLSKLKKLTYLDLSFNHLTGSIPPSLSELLNLVDIHLDRNKLTGSIPDSFGKWAGRTPNIYLSHNKLTGHVPKSLGYLNFSTKIDLSRNKLEGDASFLLGKNKTVLFVDLSRNMFEFDMSKVEFPESLTSLDLNHNKIFGSLPRVFTTTLQSFNVSYNRLCGRIPVNRFGIDSFIHNRCLCGPPMPAYRRNP